MRDLSIVDAALERARAESAAMLEAMQSKRKRRKRRRPLPTADEIDTRRSKLRRSLERLRTDRILRAWKRDRRMHAGIDAVMSSEDRMARYDAMCAGLRAECKAERYQKDARIRALLAGKLRRVGQDHYRRDLIDRASKLDAAGKQGWWGVREADGSVVVRLRDRSGLIMLDPAESRERTAELIERLLPVLLACSKRGFQIHKAVFSEPNIPAGQLAWGKAHIFNRFTKRILERTDKGEETPRRLNVRQGGKWVSVDNPARKFPEVVAAFAVQEDPLARSGHHWNTHLNVILIVDPGACTPLDRELWPEDPDRPGKIKPDPAYGASGMFSWMKLQHVWGAQVEIRKLEPSVSALREQLLEVIKYSCKTVSEKSLEKFEAGGELADDAEPFTLTAPTYAEAAPRAAAPAMIDWPAERVLEWIDANKGFRRVRAWGVLYRLGKLPRPTDPDEGIRWLGRLWISPHKITVQFEMLAGPDSLPWFNTGGQVPAIPGPQSVRAGPYH